MTTMPSWLTDAADAVATATDSAKVQAQVDTLTEARSNLRVHLDKLTALNSATTAGREAWFGGHTATPAVFDALNAAAKTPSQGNLGTLNRTLNSFATSAENKALGDWRGYVTKRMGAVSDLLQLAGTLAGVASVAPLAAALRDVLQRLVPASSELPTAAAFDLLDEAGKRLGALESALQPDTVRTFLSAVARGGASVAILTDVVRARIADNGAEGSFKIVAGSPVGE